MEPINYMEPNYDEAEIAAVTNYMRSGGWLTEFTKTREFEQQISEFTGAKYCSVMANGTVTLIASLLACGIQPGDEVIVPDFTMSATSHVVELIGARAVFVDIEPDTFCMDYDRMKAALTSKTKAVILVHLNGRYPSRFMEIIEFCKQNSLYCIEDAAQALGSNFQGRALGTFGDIGSYSFSMPKIITTGQGGAVVTNNKELYDKLVKIRDFGRESTGSDHYVMIGGNFKFTDLQAVIGTEQMKKLPDRILRKKEIARQYEQLLKQIPQVKLVKNNYEDTAPCFIEILTEHKKELSAYLSAQGIGTRFFYPPLHAEPAYQLTGKFPVTENVSRTGLWLPSASKLTNEQIERICQSVRDFYKTL